MLADYEGFILASGRDAAVSKRYRLELSKVFDVAEARGLQVDSSVAAAALKQLSDVEWDSKKTTAIGWLEEYYRAKESPERYAEESVLLKGFGTWVDGLDVATSTAKSRKSVVNQLLRLLRERGLAVPKSAADVKSLQLGEKPISRWRVIAVKQLESYFEQATLPSSGSNGLAAHERARKRPRAEEHGQGSSSGGRVVAACLGPPLNEADLMKAVDEELRGSVRGSFLLGPDGRYRLMPIEKQNDTLALALACAGAEEGTQKKEPPPKDILIGFESFNIAFGGTGNVGFYDDGDWVFRSAMFTAAMAVRLRARSICRLLGVEDVDEAVKRLCDERRVSQLVMVAHPRGLNKTGSSAGLAAALSVVALMTGRRLKRRVASTGGVALSGGITQIGGLEEKLQLAKLNDIRTVILPLGNLQDFRRVNGPEQEQGEEGPELVGVETLEDAIRIAFEDVQGPAPAGAEVEGQQEGPELVGVERREDAIRIAFEDVQVEEEKVEEAGAAGAGGAVETFEEEKDGKGQPESTNYVPPWMTRRSQLEMDEGLYWGAAQSMTWKLRDSKVAAQRIEVEIMLHPGTTRLTSTSNLYHNGTIDITTACGWLSKHQQHIRPREGKGFLLPDFAEKLATLDVTTKVNPSGELTEFHLGAAIAVAMVAAITGYSYNGKACVIGCITVDGALLPMASMNELDVVLMLGSRVEVVVVPEEIIEEVRALRAKYAHIGRSTRFVGVKTLLEALPLLLLDYPDS